MNQIGSLLTNSIRVCAFNLHSRMIIAVLYKASANLHYIYMCVYTHVSIVCYLLCESKKHYCCALPLLTYEMYELCFHVQVSITTLQTLR